MHRPDRVLGVDIDQGSLESYRRRHPESLAVRGDCYRLPFKDASFDRVLMIHAFHHFDDKIGAIREALPRDSITVAVQFSQSLHPSARFTAAS